MSAGTGSRVQPIVRKRLTGRSRAQAAEGGLALKVKPGIGPQNRLNSAPVRRIGYVLDRFPRASHDFVLQEILELQSRGIEVHIFSLGLPDGRIDDTTAALARLRGPVSYFLAEMEEDAVRTEASASQMMSTQACWIANQLTAARIEHLHAHLASAPTDVLREVRRLTGVPYSFTAHSEGLYEEEADYRLREKVADAKFVVALTEFDRGHLLRVCGADVGEKIQSIHMGIDLDECRFSAAECHDSDSVLAVGPLVEKSGFTDLIDAIAMLRDRGHAARLTIVGEGEFEEELRAQIERCGLGDREPARRQIAIRAWHSCGAYRAGTPGWLTNGTGMCWRTWCSKRWPSDLWSSPSTQASASWSTTA
jgi:glycosyltransferase involved in cell wall biosynthesis